MLRVYNINITRRGASSFFIFLCIVYFLSHSIYGRRGLLEYIKLRTELSEFKYKLEKLQYRRLEIENHAKLLRPDAMDRDMLDEKARAILGVAKQSESVLPIRTDEEE